MSDKYENYVVFVAAPDESLDDGFVEVKAKSLEEAVREAANDWPIGCHLVDSGDAVDVLVYKRPKGTRFTLTATAGVEIKRVKNV